METIAIVGAQLEQEKELFELLQVLFPECQMCTIRSDIESDVDIQAAQEVVKKDGEEYPRIRSQARQKKAQIFFGDEAGVRSDHHAGTTWAIKGKR